MSIRSGQILHVGNGSVIIDRLQTAGPGDVAIPEEKTYELGNYESIDTIYDTPDLTFTMESQDVSTEIEALLTGGDPVADSSFDLSLATGIDITSPWKAGKSAGAAMYDVEMSVGLPTLVPESISYRFGLRDNARQTVSLKGDSIFYCPGTALVQVAAGTGTAGQTIVTAQPAGAYTDGSGSRRVLSVSIGSNRLSRGVDYTVSEGTVTAGFAVTTVTLVSAVPTTSEVRVMYFTNAVTTYPQAVHPLPTVKPSAVRGRDIDIYVGGYDPLDIPGSQANRWTGVQSVTLDWRVALSKEEEFGNYQATSQEFDTPTASGQVEILPRDADALLQRLRQISGVSNVNEAIGAGLTTPLPLDIVIKNGAAGGAVLKRLNVEAARFTIPGYSGRANDKSTMTLSWSDDKGKVIAYKA